MEFNGRLQNASQDYVTGEYNITFSCGRSALNQVDKIKDMDLSIKAVKKRDRRSLNANSYAWVLMQKIAEAVNSDRWSIYLEILKKYSRAFTFLIVKPDAVERTMEQWRECIDLGEVDMNGQKGHQLQVFFGSSTFDTKEMSVFIDGIVNECKELDIETLTPNEIERMKKEWGVEITGK